MECRGGAQVLSQHSTVKTFHEFSCRPVVYLPETRDYARRARVHESARQPDEAFAPDLFAERRLAGTQHHEISREFQIVEII